MLRSVGRQVATIFPAGSTHPVYVNPARADEAFLVLPEFHMLAVLAGQLALDIVGIDLQRGRKETDQEQIAIGEETGGIG